MLKEVFYFILDLAVNRQKRKVRGSFIILMFTVAYLMFFGSAALLVAFNNIYRNVKLSELAGIISGLSTNITIMFPLIVGVYAYSKRGAPEAPAKPPEQVSVTVTTGPARAGLPDQAVVTNDSDGEVFAAENVEEDKR